MSLFFVKLSNTDPPYTIYHLDCQSYQKVIFFPYSWNPFSKGKKYIWMLLLKSSSKYEALSKKKKTQTKKLSSCHPPRRFDCRKFWINIFFETPWHIYYFHNKCGDIEKTNYLKNRFSFETILQRSDLHPPSHSENVENTSSCTLQASFSLKPFIIYNLSMWKDFEVRWHMPVNVTSAIKWDNRNLHYVGRGPD